MKSIAVLGCCIFCATTVFYNVSAQNQPDADSVSIKKNIVGHDTQSWKTENRSGIRFFANSLLGRYEEQSHLQSFNVQGALYADKKTSLNGILPPEENAPFVNAGVIFSTKEGDYFTGDLGPSITTGAAHFGKGVSGAPVYSNSLTILSLHAGVNATKRWYPYKFNIGIMVDGNYLHYAGPEQIIDPNGVGSGDYRTSNAFNVSFGVRTGGEYLLGRHVGVGLDLDFIRSHFETMKKTTPLYNGTTVNGTFDFSRIIDIPPVALGVGVNYYY